jgi:hypothetical protein
MERRHGVAAGGSAVIHENAVRGPHTRDQRFSAPATRVLVASHIIVLAVRRN